MEHNARWKTLPRFADVLDCVLKAEQSEGWLSVCEQRGVFVALNLEFVQELAVFLRRYTSGPVVEVCAGNGELARALTEAGVEVVPTDVRPTEAAQHGPGPRVLAMDAATALARFRPKTVLAVFVPVDSEVDRQVLSFPSVCHYVVLGARLAGQFGSQWLWRSEGWSAEPVPSLSRFLVTRHDTVAGLSGAVLQKGEVWWFRRRSHGEESRPGVVEG